ncbi:MAG: GNAT family N-acetyltransferase [Pyrinomonadaceae bacterium]|nr:GNAT family N-acetyltransferase [Pyrinomonadaceae bacterium]
MKAQHTPESVEIVAYAEKYAEAFARLNRAWLEQYSLLEDGDRKHLEHPRESILATGGEIFIALIGGVVVGTCAAIVKDPVTVELVKLTVDESVRGRGIGLQLSETVIAWARERGAERVVLVSSTKLEAALRLYERLGFEYRQLPADTGYETADIFMELTLDSANSAGAD